MQTIHAHWNDYNKTFKRQKNGSLYNYIRMQGKTVSQRINYFFQKYSTMMYIGACMRFAQTAAKYTPPNIGKAYIDQKYYSRPIYSLTDLAKGLVRTSRGRRVYATKEDFEALRNGFKFKVVNTKYRATREEKRHAVAYTKGINEAKRIAKIERRGLSKYSWGANLNATAEDVQGQLDKGIGIKDVEVYRAQKLPPIFNRLARKSPAITKFVWGNYSKHIEVSESNVKKINITIVNRLAEIQRYGELAIRQGLIAANRYIKQIYTGVQVMGEYKGSERTGNAYDPTLVAATKLRNTMAKLFDTDSKGYGIQRLAVEKTPKRFDPSQPWNLEINLPHTEGT